MPPDGTASAVASAGRVAGRVALGPFEVTADPSALARFPGASALPANAVPTTFPIVWLSHPAIRAAIEGCARGGEAAFHEEQSFDYREALEAGAPYRLTAEIERQDAPARIALASRLDRQGETVLTMRTVLRLIDGTLASGSAPAGAQQQ